MPREANRFIHAFVERLTTHFVARIRANMAAALDLSELPTEALVKEMERRLDCLNKPEKRLVLIGK